jgi:hypothetical protein
MSVPSRRRIAEQNRALLRRQRGFRLAAEYVAWELAEVPAVRKVVLFGSVAQPLKKEVPRFREFRRAGIELWHECHDVDLAVWLGALDCLRALQRARSRALNELLSRESIGVAHHQVEIFLMEPGSDRYLGRLCCFGRCPSDKPDCAVPGCGAGRFLKQHQGFVLRPESLGPGRSVLLQPRDGVRAFSAGSDRILSEEQ